jgi:hypothetical protein
MQDETRGRFHARPAALLLLGAAANGTAQSVQKRVLVLQSFDRGNLVIDAFTSNFRVELDQRPEQSVNFVQVVVTPEGSVGAPEQAVVNFIGSTFAAGRKPDLIVAIAGPASVFARKYRKQLFPDTPLLLAAVDERYLSGAPLGENETSVAVVNDFPRIVDEMLQVLPQTRQVFMVMGSGQLGNFWRRQLEEQFARFQDRLTFVWWMISSPSGAPAPPLPACQTTRPSTGSCSARTRQDRCLRTSGCSPTSTRDPMRPCLARTACTSALALSVDR